MAFKANALKVTRIDAVAQVRQLGQETEVHVFSGEKHGCSCRRHRSNSLTKHGKEAFLLSFRLDANCQVIGEALHTNAMQGVAMTMTK